MTVQIDRLFGSKTRVALLSQLMMNPDQSFYIRELSRDMRIPYSMLYKEVKNLVSLGVISENKRGKVTLVSVNKKLPYLAELKGLMAKTAGLVTMLRDSFSEIEGIKFALVYGSFASGDQTESSDIDLLIIGDMKEESVLKPISQVEKRIDRDINYVLWNSNEFHKRAKGKHHLLTDIIKKPIIMVAGDQDEFRRAVKKSNHPKNKTKPQTRP